MNSQFRTLGQTRVATSYPWGLMFAQGTRLLCSDGKLRAPVYLATTPDTFFSTPAAIRIRGKYITGYMTCDEATPPQDMAVTRRAYTFRPHTESNAKAGNPLPEWPGDFTDEKFTLLAAGEEIR